MNTFSWKTLFRQTVGSYFKFIALFVVNVVLVLLVTVFLDISTLLFNAVTLKQSIVLALLNVGLLANIYFSFMQLHRYMIGQTVQKAGNSLMENYIAPSIDAAVSRLKPATSQTEQSENPQQLKKNLLQQVKKEHLNTGIKYLVMFVFRRTDFSNIQWVGNKQMLSSVLKQSSISVLGSLVGSSRRMLFFCFVTSWIIVLVLIIFRFYIYKY